MTDSIYRFISFPSFVDLVQRKSLPFVTYDMWEDPYEGFILNAMKSKQGRDQIAEYLRQMQHAIAPDLAIGILSNMRYTVHLQSWTRLPETDALWRIYGSGGTGLRIETDGESISALGGVKMVDVDYRTLTLEDECRRVFTGKNQIDVKNAFSTKRKAFEHEKEVRLVTDIDGNYLPATPRRRATDQDYDVLRAATKQMYTLGHISQPEFEEGMRNIDLQEKKQHEPPNQVKRVSFSGVSNFIKSVLVHPTADQWFVSMVSEFCERNNLPYVGKSNLYTFSHE